MSHEVKVVYSSDVPAKNNRRAYLAGEYFYLSNAYIADELHPEATIVSYADGRPFDWSGVPEPEVFFPVEIGDEAEAVITTNSTTQLGLTITDGGDDFIEALDEDEDD